MSWSQKKSKISGNIIIDGTIEGDQLADDTVTASKLEESYLRKDQHDSTAYRITASGLTVDTDTLYVDNSNNRVGVGTNIPTTVLHAKGGTSSVTAASGTVLFVENSGGSNIQIGCGYWSNASITFGAYNDADAGRVVYSTYLNAMQFYTNGTVKATLTSGGNLGLNTSYPSAGIHYRGSSSSGVTPASGTGLFLDSSSNPHIQFGTGQYNSCGLQWGYYADADRGALVYVGYSNAMQFKTNGTYRMILDGSGRLGIGTTAPTTKLDVNDNSIRIRSSSTPSSNGSGQKGEICYDTNYLYVCVATNTWRRVALSTY